MSMGLARRLALVIVSSVVALVVAPFASASQPAPSPKVPCAPMVALVFKDDGGSFLAPVGEEDLLPARLVTQSRGFCANSQATGFDSGTASTFDGSSATTGFPTFHGSAPSDNEHRSSRAVYRQQISRALTYDPSPSSTTVSQFVATNTDPHDIEGLTGHDPDEIAQGIEGHTGDRFEPGAADEIAEVLRDPNAEVKPTDTGIAVRDAGRGRTIFVNKGQPWRSTAVNESARRWGRR